MAKCGLFRRYEILIRPHKMICRLSHRDKLVFCRDESVFCHDKITRILIYSDQNYFWHSIATGKIICRNVVLFS